jgi:hypothetical protein
MTGPGGGLQKILERLRGLSGKGSGYLGEDQTKEDGV